jgi:tetratricopeptide (TPR) repeat protein
MVSLLVAIAGVAGRAPATAQPARATSVTLSDLERARKHFRIAEAAKARGEYRAAAAEYLAAYALFNDPALVYDAAEVYRLAGDEPRALAFYTRYIELAPDGQAAPAARITAGELSRRRSNAAARDAAHRATPPDPPGEPAGGRTMRIAGLAAAGAGVVLLGGSVVFGIEARELSDEAASWTMFDHKRDHLGRTYDRDTWILGGLGAATVFAGGVLYYLGDRAERSATGNGPVSLAPSLGRSQITLTAAGRF